MKLKTPSGEPSILIDEKNYEYKAQKLDFLEDCPNVKGRFFCY